MLEANSFKMDKLIEVTGEDFYVEQLDLIFRQPRIKDIAKFGGEEKFFKTYGYLIISKKDFNLPDGKEIEMTDFEMKMLLFHQDVDLFNSITRFLKIFLGENAEISLSKTEIAWVINGRIIDEKKDLLFLKVIKSLLKLDGGKKEEYDGAKVKDKQSQMVLEEIRKAKEKVAKAKQNAQKKDEEGGLELADLIDIFAIGNKMPIEMINNMSLIQFYNQVSRLFKNIDYNVAMEAMVHGATGVELKSWLGKIE